MSQSYTLEPELLSPTPRRIVMQYDKPPGFGMGIGCLRLFLTPFILVGIFMISVLFYHIAMPLASVTAPAVITDKDESSGEDGTVYNVSFRYAYKGVPYTGSNHMDQETYRGVEIGQAGQAAFLPWSPGYHAQLTRPPAEPLLGGLPFVFFFTVIWNGFLSVFLFLAFVWPEIVRRLYKSGVPAMGTVLEKTTSVSDKTTTYGLKYEFMARDPHGIDSVRIEGNDTVFKEAWDAIEKGDTFTVLYHPSKPRWNVLYKFGPYRVLP